MSTTKHLHLRIDFTVEIADVPPLLPLGTIDPPDPLYDGRQARLLEAIKGNPAVLTRWIHELIAQRMYWHQDSEWYDTLVGGEFPYQDILAPALACLPDEDQVFFQEGVRCGLFEEYSDMFQQSFTITEDSPLLLERDAS